jgi:cell division protein ZapA
MPQVEIMIGGRTFDVACQDGEETFLRAAAQMLDTEASALSAQIGRMPESRMLLMAGLMLADKTAASDDRLREAEGQIAELLARIDALEGRPSPSPERVEVPVVPQRVMETLAEIAARAEAVADEIDEQGAR